MSPPWHRCISGCMARPSSVLKTSVSNKIKNAAIISSPAVVSKLPNVGTTIFTVMSVLAGELGAVNLGQGFPDFPMSEELVALVDQAMRDGWNQYTHMNGLPVLREVLAAK